jgi:gamma-glutamylcyclotransferase (GGCT)/AIG2-like uncharacterized protein YtfP
MNWLNEFNTIAVYWTLKKWYGNHRVMESAQWEYIWEDYVPFESLDWWWFPVAIFNDDAKTFLKIELYKVPEDWVLNYLDRLEWHPTFYYRKNIKTLKWVDAVIYEINRPIVDNKEQWFTNEWDDWNKFYEWNR